MLSSTAPTAVTPALAGPAGPALPDGGGAADGSDAQAFAQALDAAAQAEGGAAGPAADRSADRPTPRPGAMRGRALPGDSVDTLAGSRGAADGAKGLAADPLASDAAGIDDNGTAAETDTHAADDESETDATASADLLAWLANLSLTPPAPSAATATAGLAPPSDAAVDDALAGPARRESVTPGRAAATGSDEPAGRSHGAATFAEDLAGSSERTVADAARGAPPSTDATDTAGRPAARVPLPATDTAAADAGAARDTNVGRLAERLAAGRPAERAADTDAPRGSALDATQTAAPTAGALPTLPAGWAGGVTPHATRAAPVQAELHAPLASKEFAPALGAQMSVLVRDGIEHAQLKLNPAEMGPIEVRISIDGSQAQVDFSAAQAPTRQALQDAVPALATALREQGLTLTGGGVFEQPREQRGDASAAEARASHGGAERAGAEDVLAGAAAPRPARARGVLDLYA